MDMTTKPQGKNRLLISIILFILCYFGARAILEQTTLSVGIRLSSALLPIPPFAWFLVMLMRGIRSLDELQRRIHLEALAVAYPLAMVLILTLGLLQRVIILPFEDWSYLHVWAFFPLMYFIGLTFAQRRYQ